MNIAFKIFLSFALLMALSLAGLSLVSDKKAIEGFGKLFTVSFFVCAISIFAMIWSV